MRFLLPILLFISIRCFAAVGDITGAAIETNGWVHELYISGLNTNGNFNSGFSGSYFTPTATNNLTLTLTSMGFDDNGNGIQVTRSGPATRILRLAYPMMNTNDIQPDGAGGCIARIASSIYVYSSDSNLTISARAGAYAVTNGSGTNCNAVSGLSVTNGSTLAYRKVVANWTCVPGQKVTNTMRLSAVAFHASAQQGRPVRVIRFVAQDQHSHAVTNFQTQMKRTIEPVTGVCVSEYIADMDISSFTHKDKIRCDFTAYPWIGDTNNAVMDTFDNVNVQPTPLYASITNFCENAAIFGVSYAVIDSVNGTSAGVVTTNFSLVTPPAAFSNINQAAVAMAKTNAIVFARSNIASGWLYLTNGSHMWTGGATAPGTNGETWINISSYPGSDRSLCVVTGQDSGQSLSQRVHLTNLSVKVTTAAGCFSGMENFWVDNCYIESASGVPFLDTTNIYYTANTISNLNNGLKQFSNHKTQVVLVRGNFIERMANPVWCYTVIGNVHSTTNDMGNNFFINETSGQTIPPALGCIVAYNCIYGARAAGSSWWTFTQSTNQTLGMAVVQNLVEWISTGNQVILGIANDGSTATGVTNVLLWNNTFVGQRCNLAYNESGTAPLYRVLWNCQNNCYDDNNIKTDNFTSGTPNNARIGNWSECWGVSDSGNFYGNVNNIGTAAFSHQGVGSGGNMVGGVPGLYSQETETALALNYQQFVSRLAYDGSAGGTGTGIYRLQSSSPLWTNIVCNWTLPYDLFGNVRGISDAPGAFSSGNTRKGGFF